MIEDDFDISFAANLALREKQIQQNYRPIIAVHKWFARRPGSLFRCLLLSEFASGQLSDAYYLSHDLVGKCIADPFMGGGTPILEANRVGCEVIGADINPMACWIVQEELESIDLMAYRAAANDLRHSLCQQIGHLYQTECTICGTSAPVKYFLWVKTAECEACQSLVDLFPGYLLSEDKRHPKNVLVCAKCGELNESSDLNAAGKCRTCQSVLQVDGPAKRGKCKCCECGGSIQYPGRELHGHRLFAIEYYCPACKASHRGRFFKKPDAGDLEHVAEANATWKGMRARFVPTEGIPAGDETNRLHRWNYQQYRDLFNSRQLVGLEHSCRLIARQTDRRIRHALATNLSDLLRYQNLLCRYDTMALKSLDIFSVHGFPVGLIACESNILGIPNGGVGVGSGGWSNIVDKYAKAKAYCTAPYEIRHENGKRVTVPIAGEWIGDEFKDEFMGTTLSVQREMTIMCQSSMELKLPNRSLDAVLTDPPYFGNVQYAELMDFCFVWLRRLVHDPSFKSESTRHLSELTGNTTLCRTREHFSDGLSNVFSKMAIALKHNGPLAFTFHHNRLEAYAPIAVAILDSGLHCTASIPCPAEMAASIHIHGTGSSIIDSIFVCRSTNTTPPKWLAKSADELQEIVGQDLESLRTGGVCPTKGDIRCIVFGHLTRLAVAHFRKSWMANRPTLDRLRSVEEWYSDFCCTSTVTDNLIANGVGDAVSV